MHIPAGAFNQASNNDPVLEFNCTFRYDATATGGAGQGSPRGRHLPSAGAGKLAL